ncbi:IS4 family transposase, partial [Catalinimonas sp. 4WD22]|uniref:IS4 family transposase n=1 Tax=Catalinimonas locisalis TaxID=3133978 RepID=UPI003101AD5E
MNTNVQIIAELKTFLTTASHQREKYCHHQEAFTRTRKLTFTLVVLFITNLVKKSLCIELDHFFTFIHKIHVPTKGAFSQARYKLKAVFFQDWNKHLIIKWTILNANSMKRWKGFQLCAMDGTTALLPNRPAIMKVFGSHLNQAGSFALAQVMICYDVLNGICLKSKISSAHADELSTALKWINLLPDKTLTVYDRGYAGFALIYLHMHFKRDFLLRCQTNFNKTVHRFVNGSRQTAIVTFTATPTSKKRLLKLNLPCDLRAPVKVRLVKVKLPSGQTEVLITSLLDQEQFPTICFGQLYCFRWGIETYY